MKYELMDLKSQQKALGNILELRNIPRDCWKFFRKILKLEDVPYGERWPKRREVIKISDGPSSDELKIFEDGDGNHRPRKKRLRTSCMVQFWVRQAGHYGFEAAWRARKEAGLKFIVEIVEASSTQVGGFGTVKILKAHIVQGVEQYGDVRRVGIKQNARSLTMLRSGWTLEILYDAETRSGHVLSMTYTMSNKCDEVQGEKPMYLIWPMRKGLLRLFEGGVLRTFLR